MKPPVFVNKDIPQEVLVYLSEAEYELDGERFELDPTADNLMWRFVVEMIENCSRVDCCIELWKDNDETCDDGNDYWYLIKGLATGELFLVYSRVSSLSTDGIVIYRVNS